MIRLVLIALIALGYHQHAIAAEVVDADANTEKSDADILAAAKQANMYYQNRRGVLLRQLESADDALKIKAIEELSTLQEPSLIAPIAFFIDFNRNSDEVVRAACRGLARLNATNQSDALTKITQHPNASAAVKKAAWNALGRLNELKAIHFTDQSDDLENAIRGSGITNLGIDKVADAGKVLAYALLNDHRAHVRRMAAIGLGKLSDVNFAESLLIALTDGDVQVRRFAANALVTMDHKPAIPYLLIQLESNIGGKYLNQSLMVLTGEDFGYKDTGTLTARRDAIARGFTWYTENSKDF